MPPHRTLLASLCCVLAWSTVVVVGRPSDELDRDSNFCLASAKTTHPRSEPNRRLNHYLQCLRKKMDNELSAEEASSRAESSGSSLAEASDTLSRILSNPLFREDVDAFHKRIVKRSSPPQLDEDLLFKLMSSPEAVQLVLDFFAKQEAEQKKKEKKKFHVHRIQANGGQAQRRQGNGNLPFKIHHFSTQRQSVPQFKKRRRQGIRQQKNNDQAIEKELFLDTLFKRSKKKKKRPEVAQSLASTFTSPKPWQGTPTTTSTTTPEPYFDLVPQIDAEFNYDYTSLESSPKLEYFSLPDDGYHVQEPAAAVTPEPLPRPQPLGSINRPFLQRGDGSEPLLPWQHGFIPIPRR